jgi:hypothetical protein
MTDSYVHLLYNSGWKFHQLAARQLLSGQPVRYGKGMQYGPSITYKFTPAGSLSSSQPGGLPCWASPLAFGLIGYILHGVFFILYSFTRWMRSKRSTVREAIKEMTPAI